MNVLIIGGTGLISTGIVSHLLDRGADVTVLNRGMHESSLSRQVKTIACDRNDQSALTRILSDNYFDCIIDMVCFKPEQASAAIQAASGRCAHYIFCSTVCTYGLKTPLGIFIDEDFPQQPISDYGRNKLACENLFLKAHTDKILTATIIRPSTTYGPGNPLIDNIEFNPVAWDRIQRNLPVLCGGDGLGLWVFTHRDDCAKLFAYSAMNPRTFGQCYNATRSPHLTWTEYHRQIAKALGKTASLVFMPARWIVAHDPERFTLLREITISHGAYDSSRARRDVPEFQCEIDLPDAIPQVFDDIHRRGAWRDSANDPLYDAMVEKAIRLGSDPILLD